MPGDGGRLPTFLYALKIRKRLRMHAGAAHLEVACLSEVDAVCFGMERWMQMREFPALCASRPH